MFRSVLAAALAAALISAPAAPALAQAKPEASEKKAEKKLSPQQQKMKDCSVKWQEHKKANNVKGRDEYRKFLGGCLKA
jgi:Ni/Co efflux regulator RcnB